MRVLLRVSLFVAACLSASTAFAGTPRIPKGVSGICQTLTPFNNVLYKYETSSGIGNNDSRDGSCSLIAGSGPSGVDQFPHRNPLNIYDSNGHLIGKLGLYQFCADCAFTWRYYSESAIGLTGNCAWIAEQAFKDTKNYRGYISLPNFACYYMPDIRGRYGAVYTN